jgi:thioredoxin-related protein
MAGAFPIFWGGGKPMLAAAIATEKMVRAPVPRSLLLSMLLGVGLLQSTLGAEEAGDGSRDPRQYFFTQTFGDLPEELNLAREQGKAGMLLFYEMEGCPYCEAMLRTVLNKPVVQDWYAEHFVSIAVDIKGDVELTDFDGITLPSKVFADHRRVNMTPAVAFIDLDGTEVFRHWGAIRSAEDFLLMGRYVLEGRFDDIAFESYREQQGLDPTGPVVGTRVTE